MDLVHLDPVEARVVGALAEKKLVTPQQYPLTLNALVLACNQSSNRDPVVDFSDDEVLDALSALKDKQMVRFVHPSHGRSAVRYRLVIDELLGIGTRSVALLAVLLLRGPQTLGELRSRTERMVTFADLADVEAELDQLASREQPLVARLERRPGQKEERYVQLLTEQAAYDPALTVPPARYEEPNRAGGVGDLSTRVSALESAVAFMEQEVHALRRELDDLRSRLGG